MLVERRGKQTVSGGGGANRLLVEGSVVNVFSNHYFELIVIKLRSVDVHV